MRADHYKISHTAVTCAEARAKYTDMSYAKEIYRELAQTEEGHINRLIPEWLKRIAFLFPSIRAKVSVLEGRYRSTDEAMKKFGENAPILEIASGLSARGLNQAEQHTVYLETDLEGMIARKSAIVQNIRAKKGEQTPKNHIMQALNPLHYYQLDAAGKLIRSLDPKNPIVVVHEGLFGYLDRKEQETLRDNMKRFFKEYSPNGAWVSPDFSSRVMRDPSLFIKFVRSRMGKKTGRKLTSFKNDEEVVWFMREGALKAEFMPNEHIARELSCISKLDLRLDDVIKNAKNYRACVITLP